MKEKERFFKQEVPALLDNLEPFTAPKWGILNAQAMIEHLVGSWRISNGKAQAEQVTPEDQLPKYREFLFSDQPFQPHVKNPVMPENEAPALRKKDLKAAKAQLKQEIQDFFSYHEANPEEKPIHPVFGPLDAEGWLQFQYKHMRHHFWQFGLIDQ